MMQRKQVLGWEATYQAGRLNHPGVRLFFHSLRLYVITEMLVYVRSLREQVCALRVVLP